MATPVIRKIGRYELLNVIGQGGMGIVYRATDTSMGRTVAIKMLYGAYADDKDLLARFHREVRSTATLQHKNIVTIYALDDFEGSPYMVLEFLEGQSIAEIIASRNALHLTEKIQIVGQVCDGLQYAHRRDVIHRDIKPANILVCKDGVAKIVDFGIARVGMSDTITQTGQIIGSVSYMSPEQITGRPLDSRTDVYSAGVMLYEFITGELPFKDEGNDAQAILIKILKDPVPSVGKYLTNYPLKLDEILAKAMAKNVDLRYQTAEEFAYELSRLEESLKRDMTEEFLAQARIAISQNNWERARQQLQEVLKFNSRNNEANELLQFVRNEFLHQQRSVQIAQLRSQGQFALAEQRYEEALECLQQARQLDPNDEELITLLNSIRDRVEAERELSEALDQSSAALYAGDLSGAQLAVDKALAIDQQHPEARAVERLIQKETEERKRKSQSQGWLEEARRDISSRNFLAALGSLQKAQAIDPGDSNIRELLNWAARGHEQEKLRAELQSVTSAIGKLLHEERYLEAVEACLDALAKFPSDASIQKLHLLATRQCEVVSQRQAADQASAVARGLAEEGRRQEAMEVLRNALKSNPDDPNLQMLLSIIESEAENEKQEREERERRSIGAIVEEGFSGKTVRSRQQDSELLISLKDGLARKLPMSALRPLGERLALTLGDKHRTGKADEAASSVLNAYHLRLSQWESDCEQLDEIHQAMSEAQTSAAVSSLFDRASAILEAHGKDEEVRRRFSHLRQFMEGVQHRREEVHRQLSDLVASIEGSEDLASAVAIEEQAKEVSSFWLDDASIGVLTNRISFHGERIGKRRNEALRKLSELASSLSVARSVGQIRFLNEQAQMLAWESVDDDVLKAFRDLQQTARIKLEHIDGLIAQLKGIAARIAASPILAEMERDCHDARRLVPTEFDFEETNDLLKRMLQSVEERRKEYRRVGTTLERLIDSASVATGQAELDLIQARSRDLLKIYLTEVHFNDLKVRLDTIVSDRRGYLAAAAAVEEAQGAVDAVPSEESFASASPGTVHPEVSPSVFTNHPSFIRPSRHRLYGALVATIVAALGTAFILRRPKTVLVRIDPDTAQISIDDKRCVKPCMLRLHAGRHEVIATQPGFEVLHQVLVVPWVGTSQPVYTLSPLPKSVTTQASVVAEPAGRHEGTLAIDTKVAGVSVFVDGRLAGKTSSKGQLFVRTVDGDHQLMLEKQGYKDPGTRIISLTPRQTAHVTVLMEISAQPVTSRVIEKPAAPITPVAVVTKTSPTEPVTTVASKPQPPQLPEIKLTSSAERVTEGQSITLTWQTTNASDVLLEGSGTVGLSGSKQLLVERSTTYRLIAKGAGGSASETLHVEMIPAPKAVPASPVDLDRQGIKQALHRYKEAYESESLEDMKKAWPSISKEQQKGLREAFQFNAIRLDLAYKEEDIHVDGNEASVNCRQAFTYTVSGRKQPGPVSQSRIALRKQAGIWIVDSVSNH